LILPCLLPNQASQLRQILLPEYLILFGAFELLKHKQSFLALILVHGYTIA
jgi:hypothetical protein